jgi:hypothetical protein
VIEIRVFEIYILSLVIVIKLIIILLKNFILLSKIVFLYFWKSICYFCLYISVCYVLGKGVSLFYFRFFTANSLVIIRIYKNICLTLNTCSFDSHYLTIISEDSTHLTLSCLFFYVLGEYYMQLETR